MKFKVTDKDGKLYFVYDINFHMSGGANPFIQFLMWSNSDSCWLVDDASKYVPIMPKHL